MLIGYHAVSQSDPFLTWQIQFQNTKVVMAKMPIWRLLNGTSQTDG